MVAILAHRTAIAELALDECGLYPHHIAKYRENPTGIPMNWTGGYVADLGYTAGFYRETAPSHMAFAALALGKSPGRALKPHRILELGFGQGFGLALLAAANPDVTFEGCDFNPEHVAHARRLTDGAELSNLSVTESSFEEAAKHGGDNDLDIIILHGILTWVSPAGQAAIVDIVRQRLQPNGIVYVSYNCMPGWAPLAPIREFMNDVKQRNPGRVSDRQISASLDLLRRLRDGGAHYFAANPAAAQHLQTMITSDPAYLAHEYLNDDWHLFRFSEIVAKFAEAKLSFVASAMLTENLDQYAVPPNLRALLQEIDDPILRETIRDYAGNRRFRRDLLTRGTALPTPAEHRRMLSGLEFALTVPRDRVTFKFFGPLGELTGIADLYSPIIDQMLDRNAPFETLAALPQFGAGRLGTLLDCLILLVQSGQVLPIVSGSAIDHEPAKRLNRLIIENAKAGRFYRSLAAPAVRAGVNVSEFDLLALSAVFDGKGDTPPQAAQYGLAILKNLGKRPIKDGRLLEDDKVAVEFLVEQFTPVLSDALPVWRRLGVL